LSAFERKAEETKPVASIDFSFGFSYRRAGGESPDLSSSTLFTNGKRSFDIPWLRVSPG
jgi:hypothetical protein